MASFVLTVEWIRNKTIEDDSELGLGKAALYEDYCNDVRGIGFQPIPQEAFGMIVRDIHPRITSRRLGPRESSTSTYIGIRRRCAAISLMPEDQNPAPVREQRSRVQHLIDRIRRLQFRLCNAFLTLKYRLT